MVKKLLRPGLNGVSDWLIQRVSAIVLVFYILFLLGVFILGGKVDFFVWKKLFSCWMVQLFTLLALMSLLFHAWVGIWTVITDYVKCGCIRLVLEILLLGSLFFYLVWGIKILWGVTL